MSCPFSRLIDRVFVNERYLYVYSSTPLPRLCLAFSSFFSSSKPIFPLASAAFALDFNLLSAADLLFFGLFSFPLCVASPRFSYYLRMSSKIGMENAVTFPLKFSLCLWFCFIAVVSRGTRDAISDRKTQRADDFQQQAASIGTTNQVDANFIRVSCCAKIRKYNAT